ncbi:MAG: hypothetical protein AAGE52_10715 [Myxococcota bacterium]
MVTTPRYPFRFYGEGFELADRTATHFLEVRFESFIDFIDRVKLADPVEAAIDLAAVDDLQCRMECADWMWCRDWALLRLTQTDPSVDTYPLGDMAAEILHNVHRHFPIAEAVCLCAPKPWNMPWHVWSVKQHPEPSAAPTWDNDLGIPLPTNAPWWERERFDGLATRDEPFEVERRRRRLYNDEAMGR